MVKRTKSTGSTLLFVAFLLPILFCLLSLGIDLSGLYLDRGRYQSVLDSAVLLGAKHLPFSTEAGAVTKRYIHTYTNVAQDRITVTASADRLSASLQINLPLSFFGYFETTNSIDYSLTARARVNPRDIAIFVDNSQYLAPDHLGTEFYGYEQGANSAGYFTAFLPTSVLPPAHDREILLPWAPAQYFRHFPKNIVPLPNPSTQRQLVFTQQCFSPALTGIKQGAIGIYDYTSNFSLNSVGVFAGPGQGGNIFQVRGVVPGGFVNPGQAEGTIENRLYSGAQVRDQDCLAAAETADQELRAWQQGNSVSAERERIKTHQTQWSDYSWTMPARPARYGFPSYSVDLGSGPPRSPFRGDGQRLTRADTGEILPGASEMVSLREALWARAVHPIRTASIGAIIRAVGGALNNANPRNAERGGLSAALTSTAYIILGDFPNTGSVTSDERFPDPAAKHEMRTALSEINSEASSRGKTLLLYFIVVRHAGLYRSYSICRDMVCPPFLEDFNQFDDFLNGLHYAHVKVLGLRTPDEGTMAADLIEALPASEKSVMLTN